MYVAVSLGLASQLDDLGLSAEAAALEADLGDVAAITQRVRAHVCVALCAPVRACVARRLLGTWGAAAEG